MPNKRIRLNFHRRIGIKHGVYPFHSNYGIGRVIGLRLWWSTLTLTIYPAAWSRKP